jgi:hypothetical protein
MTFIINNKYGTIVVCKFTQRDFLIGSEIKDHLKIQSKFVGTTSMFPF